MINSYFCYNNSNKIKGINMEILVWIVLLWSFYRLWKYSKEKKKLEKETGRKIGWFEFNKIVTDKQKKKDESKEIILNDDTKENNSYPNGTPIEIIDAYERQSFDEMRRFLQQIAYGMVDKSVSQEDKDEFKKIMTYFANRDPLYKDMIIKLIPVIAKQEGILQSKIYPYIPEHSPETIRYVLYFAHELGDVRRVKKGRSYQLFTSTYVETEVLEH